MTKTHTPNKNRLLNLLPGRTHGQKPLNSPVARRVSLGVKLPTIVITLLVLAFLVSTFLSVQTSRSALTDQLQKTLLAQSVSQTELIRSHLVWTRSMAVDLAAMAGTVDQSESDQLNTIESMLANNDQVYGSTIAYEPYRFQPDLFYWSPYYSRDPDGKLRFTQLGNPDYNYFKWDWYALPKEQQAPVLSPPYFDKGGGEIWMVTWSVPFFDSTGNVKGVATADIAFSQTQEIVRQIAVGTQGYAFLIDKQGTLMGIGDHGGKYQIMVDSMLAGKSQTQDASWTNLINSMVKGGSGFTNATDPNGQSVFVAYQPIGLDTGWSLGLTFPQTELFQPATQLRNNLIIFAFLVAMIFAVILFFFTRTITRPLQELAMHTTRFSQEQLEKGQVVQPIQIQSHDELEDLANSFNQMAKNLVNAFESLEGKVANRTQSLELAAEVGRSVSQVRALDVMLKDAAEIIRSRFDLYYVQVYLTNPSQTALVLQSGTGTVGAELIGRGHQLPLNTGSINGRAAAEKRSMVISDTAASATFRPNPLLPDTRSEMAVPLLIGEKVVGVLDLQSQNAGSLSRDILPAFEALAGQLAIAIQNANLLSEAEQARAEVEAQARRQSRANWTDYLDAIHKPEETGFVFEQNEIKPITQESQSPMNENTLTAPIAVTGEALGNLVVEMEGQSPISHTSELVNSVARQVAQQIESLRLLDSAERYRFEAEEASRRLTREGWKDYVGANAAENLSFIYDLKEVRPHNHNGDQETDEAALTLPLKVRDETVGRLVVQDLGSDDKESLDLATAVAERLGAHIESLRQYDQTQSALAQSEKLFDASSRLAQAADLQGLVGTVIETLKIPEINRAILVTFNYGPTNDLSGLDVIANWWNGSGHEVTPVGTHYSLEVIRLMPMFISPTPVFFNDTSTDERVDSTTMELVKRLNLRAVAVLPLHSGAHQVGALILESEGPHKFTQSEARLYTALAPQIATVLENRRQFEQAQKQAERESTLNLISQKIQSATTVEAVLQIAARELGHALGAPMTIAQLSMKEKK